jgi:hypothetical protein
MSDMSPLHATAQVHSCSLLVAAVAHVIMKSLMTALHIRHHQALKIHVMGSSTYIAMSIYCFLAALRRMMPAICTNSAMLTVYTYSSTVT